MIAAARKNLRGEIYKYEKIVDPFNEKCDRWGKIHTVFAVRTGSTFYNLLFDDNRNVDNITLPLKNLPCHVLFSFIELV